jgi:hypothetical protein
MRRKPLVIAPLADAAHKPKKAVSHREYRDHRGKTNGCNESAINLLGVTSKM